MVDQEAMQIARKRLTAETSRRHHLFRAELQRVQGELNCFGRRMVLPRMKRSGRFTVKSMNCGFLIAPPSQKDSLRRSASATALVRS